MNSSLVESSERIGSAWAHRPPLAAARMPGGINDGLLPTDTMLEAVEVLTAKQRRRLMSTVLQALCDMTDMRFAAVAQAAQGMWTLCAMEDRLGGDLCVGSRFDPDDLLYVRGRQVTAAIAIEHASTDPRCVRLVSPRLGAMERYVCVPIVLPGGDYFGTLFATDPHPETNSKAVLSIFTQFAVLIGAQIEAADSRDNAIAALCEERATAVRREEFIAILGHDLRNPLQAISATSELLARNTSDSSIAAMGLRIKATARRMARLVDDVLDVSRARFGGGIGVTLADVSSIDPALTLVVREIQDGWPNRQIAFDCHVARVVRCDIGRVQQLASNLISNALTHGFSETIIKVSACTEGGDLLLRVHNEGEPIPAAQVARIFEPFAQADATRRRDGLGLGLHICSQIARAHGGQISVHSTSLSGTTFTARLPLSGCATVASEGVISLG